MAMTNKEAYLDDLEEIKNGVDELLRLFPVKKTKKEKEAREQAEEIASKISALVGCMKNDYIPIEM